MTEELLQEQCEKLQRDICKFLVGLDEEIINSVCDVIEGRFEILKNSI